MTTTPDAVGSENRRQSSEEIRPRAFTVRHVATVLGIGYRQVLELIHADRIGWFKAGKCYMVPDAEVERFLQAAIDRAKPHVEPHAA